jgi:hypothetical protein
MYYLMAIVVPIITKAERADLPICPHCKTPMALLRVVPEGHNERWQYNCPICAHKTSIKVEPLE